MSRQVYTEDVSGLWAFSSWCEEVCLSYGPVAGHNTLYGNCLSASEPRAVTVRRTYLQGLGTWHRGHIVQGYCALTRAQVENQNPDPSQRLTWLSNICGRAPCCRGTRIRLLPLGVLRSQLRMQSTKKWFKLNATARTMAAIPQALTGKLLRD